MKLSPEMIRALNLLAGNPSQGKGWVRWVTYRALIVRGLAVRTAPASTSIKITEAGTRWLDENAK